MIPVKEVNTLRINSLLNDKAYQKTGTRDPSGTLEKPKNQDPGS